jgi:hypothetical protein
MAAYTLRIISRVSIKRNLMEIVFVCSEANELVTLMKIFFLHFVKNVEMYIRPSAMRSAGSYPEMWLLTTYCSRNLKERTTLTLKN